MRAPLPAAAAPPRPRHGRCSAPVVAAALLRPAAARPPEGAGAGRCRAQAARAGHPRLAARGRPCLAATSAGGGREGPSCVLPGALALGSGLPEPSLNRAPGSTSEACRRGRGPCVSRTLSGEVALDAPARNAENTMNTR